MHGSMVPLLQRDERDDQQDTQHKEPRKQLTHDLKKAHEKKKRQLASEVHHKQTTTLKCLNEDLVTAFQEKLTTFF